MADKKGVIYIMTNPSFPEYVKIGYTNDVERRRDELNNSTAVPYAFRIFATYEVDSNLSDKKLHAILDKLNPSLRTQEKVDGKMRVREFYAMSPEDAYSILEAIAEINGLTHRLKKWVATDMERREEETAQMISEAHREQLPHFTFSACNIAQGEQIEFCCDGNIHSGELCTVKDDRHVEYDGKRWSMTSLAKHFTGLRNGVAGPRYFKYKGKWLNDIRHELGV